MPQAVRRTTNTFDPNSTAYHSFEVGRNPHYQVPSGFHTVQGPYGPRAVQNPTFMDWLYNHAPQLALAAGSVGLATGPALAGTSALTQAGAHAGMNAGMTAAGGGGLKDIALAGAGGLTGGSGMAWTDILKDPNTWASVAQIAGNAAGGRQSDRLLTGQQTNQSNLADLALFTASQNAQNQAGQLDINRKQFTEDARAGRGRQALIGDLLANLQDVSINVPGVQTANITGGLRPSAMGAGGRQAAGELHKQALQALLSGDEFQGGQVLTPPTFQPMPQKGGVESTLDWLGLLGGLGGILGGAGQDRATHSQLPQTSAPQPAPVIANQRNVRF